MIGFSWQTALFAGLALALSSTALALQVMEETGDLNTRHGRLGFSVLLFQDLAAIPLIAFAPLFATTAVVATAPTAQMDIVAVLEGLGLIAVIVVVGHFALDYLLRLVALTRVKEAMTAAALLTVVGVTHPHAACRPVGFARRLHRRCPAGGNRPTAISSRRTSSRSRGCCSGCSSPPSA